MPYYYYAVLYCSINRPIVGTHSYACLCTFPVSWYDPVRSHWRYSYTHYTPISMCHTYSSDYYFPVQTKSRPLFPEPRETLSCGWHFPITVMYSCIPTTDVDIYLLAVRKLYVHWRYVLWSNILRQLK